MKHRTYITGILLVLMCTACNKGFLDTAPYDRVASATVFLSDESAEMAVNGIYQAAAQTTFKGSFINATTNLGPDSYTYGRPNPQTISIGNATNRFGWFLNVYTNFYRPVVYANDVIAGLTDNEAVTEDLRSRLIGEAKFFRGLCYFYLWNYYGDVVLIDKPVPPSEMFPRTPAAQVQEFIINDFKDAAERLPVSYQDASDVGRATKGAAIAMLGKTYLYLERWPEAETEFAKLLGAPYTYDLMDNFGDSFYWKTQNNKESVFELQYENAADRGSSFEQMYGNRSGGRGGEDYAEASTTALSVFTHVDGTPFDLSTVPKGSDAKYPKDGNGKLTAAGDKSFGTDLIYWYDTTFVNADVRLRQSMILPGDLFHGKGGVDYKVYWPYSAYVNASPPALRTTWPAIGVIPIRKFLTLGDENLINARDAQTNFPLIRFADVLLMYAEAVNEARGPVAEVYTAVKRVKTRAHLEESSFPVDLDKDGMRREIWLERYRELMFETHLYFDVKRWHVAHTNDPVFGLNNDVVDFRFEKLFTKVFREDRDYLWAIPGSEIDLNPLLAPNNPGWEN